MQKQHLLIAALCTIIIGLCPKAFASPDVFMTEGECRADSQLDDKPFACSSGTFGFDLQTGRAALTLDVDDPISTIGIRLSGRKKPNEKYLYIDHLQVDQTTIENPSGLCVINFDRKSLAVTCDIKTDKPMAHLSYDGTVYDKVHVDDFKLED